MSCLTDFCTVSPPGQPKLPMDKELFDHVKQITHGFDMDGESAEQKCTKLLFETGHGFLGRCWIFPARA